METPACWAMWSSGTSTPRVRNSSRADARMRSRFRAASARTGLHVPPVQQGRGQRDQPDHPDDEDQRARAWREQVDAGPEAWPEAGSRARVDQGEGLACRVGQVGHDRVPPAVRQHKTQQPRNDEERGDAPGRGAQQRTEREPQQGDADQVRDVAPQGTSDPGVTRALWGNVAYLVGVTLLGLALGSLLRSSAGGIATLLVVPGLLGLVLPDSWGNAIMPYLPDAAGQSFTLVDPSAGSGFGPGFGASVDLLTPGTGALVFVVWVIGLIALAATLLHRRDV